MTFEAYAREWLERQNFIKSVTVVPGSGVTMAGITKTGWLGERPGWRSHGKEAVRCQNQHSIQSNSTNTVKITASKQRLRMADCPEHYRIPIHLLPTHTAVVSSVVRLREKMVHGRPLDLKTWKR